MKMLLLALLCVLCAYDAPAQGCGICWVSDTSMIGYTLNTSRDTLTKYLYTFDVKNREKAFYIVELSLIPFGVLNPMAQKEYIEGLKYIKTVSGLPIGNRKATP